MFQQGSTWRSLTEQTAPHSAAVSSKWVLQSVIFVLYIEELLPKEIISRHSEYKAERMKAMWNIIFVQMRHNLVLHQDITPLCGRNNKNLLTNKLTLWSRGLLGKLTLSQLVKKFPPFYGTRRFITALQDPATCSYPEPAQSSPCTPITLLEDPF
jgi:hypothetical protein